MEELHVYFTGRVQGVYFRANTKKAADALNVKGWVKNLSDGRVEALFQGSEEQLDNIVDAVLDCQTTAVVNDLESILSPPGVIYEDFRIVR
ncbi:MAG TPA: acylphosphatase [Euryarchaeota archaeon]|nr:acylphosphatase [Euryarchaeota archaeon]